ncbi:MAG: integration host factor subunit alpha [Nitrospirae bacterium]|nr:integration host factor subunit alpha [Nitrospirota bacterium]MBF0556849.1 integration host factor subunit alpha [Nitrospirota bacterium]
MARGSKADIIEDIAYKIGLQKTEVRDIVEIILTLMKETLADGEDIKIPKFGTFHVRKKRVRIGRNPKTGEEIEITPRAVVTFHRCVLLAKSVSHVEQTVIVSDTDFGIKQYTKHDWAALWAEYQAGKAQCQTLSEFSRKKGINRSLLSREFQPFRLAQGD